MIGATDALAWLRLPTCGLTGLYERGQKVLSQRHTVVVCGTIGSLNTRVHWTTLVKSNTLVRGYTIAIGTRIGAVA